MSSCSSSSPGFLRRVKVIGAQVLKLPAWMSSSPKEDVYFYKVKEEEAAEYVDLTRGVAPHHTLYGPLNSDRLVPCDGRAVVDFALMLDGQSILGNGCKTVKVFDKLLNAGDIDCGYIAQFPYDPIFNVPWNAEVFSTGTSPVSIFIKNAIMYPGAVAKITITILNKPANVRAISGSIHARPCSFIYKIPLISEAALNIQEDSSIVLKRSVVATRFSRH